jgi:hypothetical protein
MIELLGRRRRAIGVALAAYGVVGLGAGIMVVSATIWVGLGMQPTVASVDQQRDAIVASLERSSSALQRTAALADEAAGALENAAGIGSETGVVTARIAATMTRLADTFGDFQVLGARPFGPLASDATGLAAQLTGVAIDLDALGTRLGRIGTGIPALTEDLRATSARLALLTDALTGLAVPEAAETALRWLVAGVAVLVAWLLVPALAALVAGIALLRSGGPPGAR